MKDNATLYYDGACPLCSREISLLQPRAQGLVFKDVHSLESSVGNLPDTREMLRRLHLEREDGSLVTGLDANIAMWQYTRYGMFWKVLEWPIVRPIARFVYEKWADARYRKRYMIKAP